MASFNMDARSGQFSEQAAWNSLKKAIAGSSGFKSWQLERKDEQHLDDQNLQDLNLETLVHAYLRETLATLAY
jgi:hypothetical protein